MDKRKNLNLKRRDIGFELMENRLKSLKVVISYYIGLMPDRLIQTYLNHFKDCKKYTKNIEKSLISTPTRGKNYVVSRCTLVILNGVFLAESALI